MTVTTIPLCFKLADEMKTAKIKILHLVFRNSNSSTEDVNITRSRSLQDVVQHAIASECDSTHVDACQSTEINARSVKVPMSVPEMTAQEFNDLFPGRVELLYEQPLRQQKICETRVECYATIKTFGTSFLDLPREIRDEIYRYHVASLYTIRNIRKPQPRKRCQSNNILANVPRLCRAIPLLSEEILEMHYKYITLRFGAGYGDGPNRFLQLVERGGPVLIRSIRRIQLTHRFSMHIGLPPHFDGTHIRTTIEQKTDGSIEVSTTQNRASSDCHCGIAELVQERLLREDAQNDVECMHRIEASVQYGPVFGFALQLLEAVHLARAHEARVNKLPCVRRRQLYSQLPSNCIMCGKTKWSLRY